MKGCFVMDVNSKKGGLIMLWMAGYEVDIQSFSFNHVDTIVKIKGEEMMRVTRCYGHPKLQLHHQS